MSSISSCPRLTRDRSLINKREKQSKASIPFSIHPIDPTFSSFQPFIDIRLGAQTNRFFLLDARISSGAILLSIHIRIRARDVRKFLHCRPYTRLRQPIRCEGEAGEVAWGVGRRVRELGAAEGARDILVPGATRAVEAREEPLE